MTKIKRFFNTPKKAIIAVVCIIAILAVLTIGTAVTVYSAAKNSAIGGENAQNFAFADAGVDPVNAQVARTEFEYERGQFIYEVEFKADGKEYEYHIKAADGTVIKKEVEIDDDYIPNITPEPTPSAKPDNNANEASEGNAPANTVPLNATNVPGNNVGIGVEAAKAKALADAKVDVANATFTKNIIDIEDGVQVYDIEFFTTEYEYEYEINAETGAIIDKDVERLEVNVTPAPNTGNPEYIGIDRAKTIAVERAGFAIGEVTFKKATFDNDDGIMEYEIEFFKDGIEYECTVNAITGAIIEYDSERAD